MIYALAILMIITLDAALMTFSVEKVDNNKQVKQ